MTATTACPNDNQLEQLIEGSLPDSVLQDLTDHVELCATCQDALQTIATGGIAVDDLICNLDSLNPSSQSAFWKAISNLRDQEHRDMGPPIDSVRTDTPASGSPSLADTRSPERVPGKAEESVERLAKDGLDFLAPSDDSAYIGQLHHFQVSRVLGRGGMGIVLEAFDTHLQRSVAIKVLNPQFQGKRYGTQTILSRRSSRCCNLT